MREIKRRRWCRPRFFGEKGASGQEHLAEISMNFGGEGGRGTDRILEDSEN